MQRDVLLTLLPFARVSGMNLIAILIPVYVFFFRPVLAFGRTLLSDQSTIVGALPIFFVSFCMILRSGFFDADIC